MFIELGHFALALALCVALIQSVVPMAGAARRLSGWMAVGRSAAIGQFALVALSFAALTHAYVTSDFSVSNVLENSHSAKPRRFFSRPAPSPPSTAGTSASTASRFWSYMPR